MSSLCLFQRQRTLRLAVRFDAPLSTFVILHPPVYHSATVAMAHYRSDSSRNALCRKHFHCPAVGFAFATAGSGICFFLSSRLERTVFSCARPERCPRNGEILARLLRHRSTIEIRLALNFASANAASASFSTLPPPTQHRLTLNFASANAASAWLFSDFRRDHGDSGRFFCSVFEHLDGMNRCRAGLHVPGNILVACLLPRRSISMPLTEQLSVSVSIIWRQLLQ